jgi:uncharacterized membrane protein YccF (DUF307 family)
MASAHPLPFNVTINVQGGYAPTATPPPTTTPAPAQSGATQHDGPELLVRVLYFLFIGWWLSLIWLVVAWILNVTIIGLPIGVLMLNKMPQVVTLKPTPARSRINVSTQGNSMVVTRSDIVQEPFLLRAIYFVLVGWWLSLLWSGIAWSLCVSLIGMPIAFLMFDQVPAVTTLER